MSTVSPDNIANGKTLAFVSYITIFGALLAMLLNSEKKNSYAAFHIRPGLGLWITYMIIALVIYPLDIMGVYYAFWIFIGSLIIYGMIAALSGWHNKVPILGGLYQKIFKSIGT